MEIVERPEGHRRVHRWWSRRIGHGRKDRSAIRTCDRGLYRGRCRRLCHLGWSRDIHRFRSQSTRWRLVRFMVPTRAERSEWASRHPVVALMIVKRHWRSDLCATSALIGCDSLDDDSCGATRMGYGYERRSDRLEAQGLRLDLWLLSGHLVEYGRCSRSTSHRARSCRSRCVACSQLAKGTTVVISGVASPVKSPLRHVGVQVGLWTIRLTTHDRRSTGRDARGPLRVPRRV